MAWFGIKCSSFTGVNRGTSKRSASNSTGDTAMPSVVESNGLLERINGIEIFRFQETFLFMQNSLSLKAPPKRTPKFHPKSIFSSYILNRRGVGPIIWTLWNFEPFLLKNGCRTVLLLMVVSCKLGVWILEQPASSVLEFYPAFIHMLKYHYDYFGAAAVTKL